MRSDGFTMESDADLGFDRQRAWCETILRDTMGAFKKRLEVAEQDKSLRMMTRLIVPRADHEQPRRRHLRGELYRFSHQEATFGTDWWLCICPAPCYSSSECPRRVFCITTHCLRRKRAVEKPRFVRLTTWLVVAAIDRIVH